MSRYLKIAIDALECRCLFAAAVPLPTPYGYDWREVSPITLSYNGSAWFTGSAVNATATGSDSGLYRSDGTHSTFMDTLPMLADASFSAAAPPAIAAGKMFMLVNAKSLYVTDGTASGTVAISSAVADNNQVWAQVFDNRVYYRQKNGSAIDLYSTDGTTAGTKRLTNGLSDPYVIGSANGWVYYKQSNGHGVFAISRTDGTNTEAVATVAAGSPEGVQHFRGNQVLFTVRGYRTNRLWVSDNTSAGTRPLDSTLVVVDQPRIFNGIAYFLADDGTGNVSYYRTDGSLNGTYVIRPSGVTTNYPYYPAILQSAYFGDKLYLGGQSTGRDPILMISPDGTVQTLDATTGGSFIVEGERLWLGSQYVTLAAPTTVIQTDGGGGARTADGHYVYSFRDSGNHPRIYTWDSTTAQAPLGSVAGTVYRDDNGDNTRTSADPVLRELVTVYADLNANGILDDGEPSTPAGPTYFLDNVPPGNWPIAVAAQNGVVSPAGPTVRVTVYGRSNTANIYLLASYKQRLSGIVFNDANANGVQDAGEGILSGVKVFITADPAAATPSASDKYAYSDSTGRYLLTDVVPGGYLRAVLPSNSYASTTAAIDLSTLPTNFVGVTPVSAIGLQGPGKVQFDFAADTDADNLITAGDASVAGLAVPIYADLDNNGSYTAGEPSLLAADEAILGSIPAGPQTIRAILPQGWSSNWSGAAVTVQVPGGGATLRLPQLALTPAATNAILAGRVAVDNDFDHAVTSADAGVPLLTLWNDSDANTVRGFTESYTFSRGDGSYSLDSLPGGTVRLAFPNTVYTTLAGAAYINVDPASTPTRDIPLYTKTQQVRLSGIVRFDANNDGLVDANDPPMAGVTIVSSQGQGAAFSVPVTTDANGRFVAYAAAGTFSPTIAYLSGYSLVTATTPTKLAVGDAKDDFQLLVKGPSSTLRQVSGKVYQDLNFNGVQDAGEPPLAGLSLFADYNLSGIRGTTEPIVVTAADGTYTLGALFPSTFDIVPIVTTPMAVTNFVAGRKSVNLSAGDVADLNFGIGKAAPAIISVYRDVDNDGALGTFDVAASVSRVWADLDNNGVYDPNIDATAVQTVVGSYTLNNLPPDRSVSIYANAANTTFLSSNPIVLPAAAAGTSRTGTFAVKTAAAAIAGRVYMDYNENGQFDANESSSIGSVTLRNPTSGTIVATASIFSDSTFRFLTVPAGTYQLTYTPAAGFETRQNASGVTVTVGEGEFSNSTIFGFYYPRVTITGHVGLDIGVRGTYDGDPPLAGVRAFIDTNGNTVLDPGERTALTDATGTYTFADVRYLQGSGYHTFIVIENPSQMVRTAPYSINPYIETWGGGDVGTTLFAPPTGTLITGYLYKDLNTNGLRDPGEPGIPRQSIGTDLGNTYANTVLTDHEGFYAYSPLWASGIFDLTPVLPANWISTDPLLASSKTVTVGANARVDNVNFGYVDFQIGGRLFTDLNDDGELDGSETPIAGRRVWIDADKDNIFDQGERFTTSDADGYFAFANTGGGTFHLVQDKPAGEPGAAVVDVTVLTGGATGGVTFGRPTIAQPATFTLDDGTGQFSMVRTIDVTLDAVLTEAGVPASAFTLVRHGRPNDVFIPRVISLIPLSSGRTTLVLAFTGPDMVGGSLGNGRYTLTVDGNQLTDAAGRPVDAAGNGTRGSTASLTFNRLYGDYDASGRVDFNDFLWLQNSFGATRGRGDYIAGLDSDSNGVIDFNDFLALQNNFGMSV